MADLPFRPAKELAALIRKKKFGCLELLDTYLARLAKYNPRLNAIIVTEIEAPRRHEPAPSGTGRAGAAGGLLRRCRAYQGR